MTTTKRVSFRPIPHFPPRKIAAAPRPEPKVRPAADEMSVGKGSALRAAFTRKLTCAAPLPPREQIINQPLYDFLQAHPEIKTVQNLVNASYKAPGNGWTNLETHLTELGIPKDALNYRSANLTDWAVVKPVPAGMPSTVEAANAFFVNQYLTDFNPYAVGGVSNNCGPASLAMCLQIEGKMPPGLNPEQRIDHARALMYPGLDERSYAVIKDANGNDVRLLDKDRALTAMGGIVAGAAGAGLETKNERGWGALETALGAGNPVVLEGTISSAWRKAVASHPPGSYAGGGTGHFIAILGKTADGKYLVADPMYSGGTVAMSREELKKFFAGDPSFAQI